MSALLTTLPVVRLRFLARAEAPLCLPPYTGSMLRGALGHALKALAPLPHPDDGPCALKASCLYCQLFTSPAFKPHSLQKFSQMPHPYVIEPMAGDTWLERGASFEFRLVLIGRVITQLPAVIVAFERALRTGLGPGQSRCSLLAVMPELALEPVWRSGDGSKLIALDSGWMAQPPSVSLEYQATLQLNTPLRLQIQGKPARTERITALALLIALARRVQLLIDTCTDSPMQLDFDTLYAHAATVVAKPQNLRWFDWGRYSQRQQREMKLGGLIGDIRLEGDLAPFAELLHIGQWIHLGKNTSFGLGGYHLTL
ncbi:MAG: CRISPR system precrRNA processing endoribonuclease RAMP protein Cas6 [Burkholderiaceae bacterium]